MFYLVRIDLPFWEILAEDEDYGRLEDQCVDADMDVLSEEEMQSVRMKYPQVRTV